MKFGKIFWLVRWGNVEDRMGRKRLLEIILEFGMVVVRILYLLEGYFDEIRLRNI